MRSSSPAITLHQHFHSEIGLIFTGAYILDLVRRLASFVAIFILLTAAAPLLACMTGKTMNQEESACCRSMHGNCGDMAKMGCCKTEVKTDQSPQLAKGTPSTHVSFAVIAWLAPVLPWVRTASPSLFRSPDEHSPPGILTAQISVLRI